MICINYHVDRQTIETVQCVNTGMVRAVVMLSVMNTAVGIASA